MSLSSMDVSDSWPTIEHDETRRQKRKVPVVAPGCVLYGESHANAGRFRNTVNTNEVMRNTHNIRGDTTNATGWFRIFCMTNQALCAVNAVSARTNSALSCSARSRWPCNN